MRLSRTTASPDGWPAPWPGPISSSTAPSSPRSSKNLSIVALERPEQARRLVANSGSASFISRAELTLAEVDEDR